jgi:hypothetical protein
VNYTQVVKNYSKPEEGRERYSPGNFVTVKKSVIIGDPDVGPAGTSHVERKNGTLRQWLQAAYPADVRLLEKMGQSESGTGVALRALQLLPDSWIASDHARDGYGH